MDKLNNKNIFSVKLFFNSFKQLKIIGLISTVIITLLSCIPIIMEGINTKNYVTMQNNAKLAETADSAQAIINNADYTTVVTPVSSVGILIIIVTIITPILALYAWSFLNKRSSCDFYHSLSYKRQNIYLTKFAAITLWQFIIFFAAYISSFICYHIFSDYFIVDYPTTLHIYFAEFICSLLCSAAIALACSLTGNIFSNICLTGLIIFLPRLIVILVHSTVTNISVTAAQTHFIPLLDSTYNMIIGQIFSEIMPGYFSSSNFADMLLSAASNSYTLILALIYAILGGLFFVYRKSETAGNPTLSWKLQFAIRSVIGFTISILGIMVYIQGTKSINNYYSDKYNYFIYIIIAFIAAALVVIIYELISSKKLHRIIKTIPSIITAYIFAIIFGVVFNAGVNKMLSYNANADNIQYIKMSVCRNYYYSDNKDYFEDIISKIKITDKDIIKTVADTINSNSANLNNIDNDYNYSARDTSEYIAYEVYIKDGILGRYRKVFFKESEINKLAANFANLDDFAKAYKNLPAYEDVILSCSDYITEENLKKVYNTLLEEVNSMSFADWYNCVNSTVNYNRDNTYITLKFTRNGTQYSAKIAATSELLPKTMNVYYNAVNEYSITNSPKISANLKQIFKDISDNKISGNIDDRTHSLSVCVYSTSSANKYYISYSKTGYSEIANAIYNELDNPFEKEFDSSKPIVEITYYDTIINDNVTYYVQLPGYNSLSDYPGYEDSADVPYSVY